jgi:hypothetical protein
MVGQPCNPSYLRGGDHCPSPTNGWEWWPTPVI